MVRYAVIGTSWITKSLISAAELAGGLSLCAVYSRTEERGKEFAAEYGVQKVYTNLSALAADQEIDAVYIASPNACHFEQAKMLLSAKKHILCEKPLARSGERVRTLLRLAEENGVVFLEAIKSMFTPGAKAIEDALPLLGRISQASFVFQQLSSRYPALLRGELPNIFNPDLEAGAVMDIGVYCLYPALRFFGAYESVAANAKLLKNGIDLYGDAILHYPDQQVVLSYSKAANQAVPSQIIGDAGAILIQKISSFDGVSLILNDGAKKTLYQSDKENDMKYEADFFRRAIETPEEVRGELSRLNRLSVLSAEGLAEIRKKTKLCF